MRTNDGKNNSQKRLPIINSLSTSITKAVEDGFAESFMVTSRGLYGISKGRYYRPEQVQLRSTIRFAEPGTSAILYIIETSDGLKGTCIDYFIQRPDPIILAYMAEVQDIHKKMDHHDRNEC